MSKFTTIKCRHFSDELADPCKNVTWQSRLLITSSPSR